MKKEQQHKDDRPVTLLNETYKGSNGRRSLIDLHIPGSFNGDLILFLHGYMGFKDWGAWGLAGDYFTSRGFAFCKFNFSHNGGTTDNGIDFPDLAAFAENSYSRETEDVKYVLDWLGSRFDKLPPVHLAGHSRGGGIALLSASDDRVASVTTWAGISSVAKRFSDPRMMEDWKSKGIRYVTNQRTRQQMPHFYSQAEDFLANREQLDIEAVCRRLGKPVLVIHGDNDQSVPVTEGRDIAAWMDTPLRIVPGADHVFGAAQPWAGDTLPAHLEQVCDLTSSFITRLRH